MSSLLEYIPNGPGLLPKWLVFVSVLSLFNTAQCYTTTSLTARVYPIAHAQKQVSPLSSRTFGTWTLITGIVRLYAASRLEEEAWYGIAQWTFVVALGHFASELLVYGSTRVNSGVWPSCVVAIGTTVWMWWCKGEYVA